MTSEEVEAMSQPILEVLRELLRTQRWKNPEQPGSAQVEELADRLNDPVRYSAFRTTTAGSYFLQIVEPLQDAMNDDWLPESLLGLTLPAAHEFLEAAVREAECRGLADSVPTLRALHSTLAAASNDLLKGE